MKAIMVMFDSLNRHMLSPYGCQWVHTPNFQRLAERTVTFTNAYVGSMPLLSDSSDGGSGQFARSEETNRHRERGSIPRRHGEQTRPPTGQTATASAQ